MNVEWTHTGFLIAAAILDGAVFYQFFENIVNTEGFDGVLPPKYILKIQQ